MEFDRARLKREVKLSMKGSGCIMVALLFSVVVSAGTWLLNTVLGGLLTRGAGSVSDTVMRYVQRGYDLEDAINIALLELFQRGPGVLAGIAVGGVVLSIIIALWQGAMDVGYEGWCLSMVRHENPPVSKIFCAMPQILQVLLTRFLTGLFIALWSLLVVLAYVLLLIIGTLLASLTDSVVLVIPFLLAAIAVLVVGVIWVSTRYLLVDYVLLDKGLYGMDAIRESKRLMRGNIGRCFVLQLSFFGWYLLMIAIVYAAAIVFIVLLATQMSAGDVNPIAVGAMLLVLLGFIPVYILSLWLKPYTTGSMAAFYDWVCAGPGATQAGSGFGGGADGWGDPGNYTWTSGGNSGSGTGVGSNPGGGLPPRPPKTPRDDPWN